MSKSNLKNRAKSTLILFYLTGLDRAAIFYCMQTDSAEHPQIIPAATVILAREQAGKLQVYLLKRSSLSGFMAGYFVFPGGTVDRHDRQFELFSNHCDMTADEISSCFGSELPPERILAYCVAAIRETFEEAGVRLFHRNNHQATDLDRAACLPRSTGLEKGWFLKFVAEGKCRLAVSSLSRWSHWITPVLMKRRFDTRFFLADMPSNQCCRPDEIETIQGLWLCPGEALAGNLAGKIPLSPPTLVTLHELLDYTKLNHLQTEKHSRPWGQARLPRLVPLAQGAVIVEPWDPMYHQEKITIDPEYLPNSVLSVGEPFSRIWCDNGIWKPIGLKN